MRDCGAMISYGQSRAFRQTVCGWLPELPTGFPRRNPGPGWPRTHTVTGQNNGAFNSTAWVGNSLHAIEHGRGNRPAWPHQCRVRHPELRLNRRARRAARPARLTRSAAPRMPLQPAAAPQRAGSRPRRHWLRSGQRGPSSVQFRQPYLRPACRHLDGVGRHVVGNR